jgi:hypothetical protein
MRIVDGGSRRIELQVRRCLGVLLAATLVAAGPAAGALTRVGDIDVQTLAQALESSPVQLGGAPNPTLRASQAKALRARIAKLDPGRIWIAVVSPVSVQATADLTQALSDSIQADGVVIVVAGSNYHVTTTWGTGEAARQLLGDAVDHPGDSLAVQLRRAINSFAKADAAAGHPGASSSESGTPGGSPASGHGGASSSGGGSGGLIGGLVVLALVLAVGGVPAVRYVRRTLRASHRHREETADAHEQAQADFIKLGEEIEALDIDSSMPGASASGKDEYSKAIECYQDAERRLRNREDSYQFERALDAVKRGRAHVHVAEQLFNATGEHPATPADEPSAEEASALPAPGQDHASPAEASSGQARDILERITKLAALRDRGALTATEFDEEKRKLLDE